MADWRLLDAFSALYESLLYLLWPITHWFRPPAVKASEIAEILVYPVKGCRGISVRRAKIKATGFQFDRHWVIASEERGRMKTQRSDPRIALIDTSIPLQAIEGDHEAVLQDAQLVLSAPGCLPLKVPLFADRTGQEPLHNVSVWDWKGAAWDEGEGPAQWLSSYLEKPCRLLRYAGDGFQGPAVSHAARRPTDAGFAQGYETAFADGFPFLLASQASLTDLNAKLATGLPMNRFRPNLIVQGSQPWQEDHWKAFRIAHEDGRSTAFRSVKPCSRCKVTTTDQETAEVSPDMEPLKTLGTFRSGSLLGFNEPALISGVYFGWNLVSEPSKLRASSSYISVGDQVLVSEWRRPAPAA